MLLASDAADAAAVPPLTLLLLVEDDGRALPLDKRCFFAADSSSISMRHVGLVRCEAQQTARGVKLDRSWQHLPLHVLAISIQQLDVWVCAR